MDIIFYGGHKWENGPWFRKQQFAKRLADRGHRIFYIEDTVSMVRKTNGNNNYFKTEVCKINDNLYLVKPSCYFPFPGKKSSRELFNIKLYHDIKSIIKDYSIRDFIFWNNQPEFSSQHKKLKGIKVFDLADDGPYYYKLAGDEKGYLRNAEYLKEAFLTSDINIVSAQKLKEKYQHFTKSEIILIPNGYDNKVQSNYSMPPGLVNIKKPIIGFIGTLFRFIDDALLEYLAENCPDYNFVFVGKIEDNFPIDKIRKFKNVFLLGHVKKDEVLSYIHHFDICINPFKVHEVNDSVSPVKVFEYLAQKKHVVSTSMYSLEKEEISDHIKFAYSHEEFRCLLDTLIKNGNIENNISDKILLKYNWDNLFKSLINRINIEYKLDL